MFLGIAQANAIGVGIKPSYLEVVIEEGQKQATSFTVYNISDEPAQFRVYADELKDWIVISPEDFRLEPQETKKIGVIITPNDYGKHATNLSVVASPLNKRQFNADSGIKVPLRLDVQKNKKNILNNLFFFMVLWFVFSIFIVLLVIYIVLKLRNRTLKERVVEKIKNVFDRKNRW